MFFLYTAPDQIFYCFISVFQLIMKLTGTLWFAGLLCNAEQVFAMFAV